MPPTIEFASLGMADSLILMVLALVVFGPRRLPQIGRQLGKLMYEFRKASNDFKFQMEEELRNAEEADRRKKEELSYSSSAPPVIQPPSTGEQVSATGPNPASITDGSGTDAASSEAVAETHTEQTDPEQAVRHG